jgi:phenylacetate 2-hydroxylase
MELPSDIPPVFDPAAPDRIFFALIRTALIFFGPLALLALLFFDSTDVPRIKNLPAVPAIPILGNLVQLGTEQPRRLAELSRKYGPVFQIRLGNRVRHLSFATSKTPY